MTTKTNAKQKEIRSQKPAQSLTAFQRKVSHGMDERTDLLKRFIIFGVAILVAIVLIVSWNFWRSHKIDSHEAGLAAILSEVEGGRGASALTAELREQRMRDALPRLEALAASAPAPCKAITDGTLASWKLELDGKAGAFPTPNDPWSRLRWAERSIVLGQAKEAHDYISIVHREANPDKAWSQIYWTSLLQIRQLEGNRQQALKDYAEYRSVFKSQADLATLDKILAAI
jgi:hypothetical protein